MGTGQVQATAERHVSRWQLGVLIAGLGALYVAAGKFGLGIHAVAGFATLVWPPTGIALAALVLFGRRLWPGVFLGATIVNLWSGAPILVALAIGLGNTLEALFAAFALARLPGFRSALDRSRDAVGLVVLAGLLAPAIAATVGACSLALGGVVGWSGFAETWRAWWVGDLIGALVVAPVFLTWRRAERLAGWRGLEAVALALATAIVTAAVFMVPVANGLAHAYLVWPTLIWAAFRFGPAGAARATFVVSALAVLGTVRGSGPFTFGELSVNLLGLQAFVGLAAATFLVLAATVAERHQLVGHLASARKGLEQRVAQRTAELQKANAALARRELQLAEAQRIAHIGSWEWDVASNAVTWSDELYRIFGMQPKTPVDYESYMARLHPADRETVGGHIAAALATAASFEVEHRVVCPDSSERWVHGRGRAVVENGNVTRLAGTAQDVTARKQGERALQEAHDALDLRVRERTAELSKVNETLSAIVGGSPIPLVANDRHLTITMWNPAAERTFGWTAEEVLGHPLGRAGGDTALAALVQAALEGRPVSTVEVECRRKDGAVLVTSVSVAPLRDGARQVVGTIAALVDVTAQRQAERDRLQLLQSLEAAVRARDTFIQVASHELKTPLTALQLQVQGALRRSRRQPPAAGSDEAIIPKLDAVDRQVVRLTKLVDNLLDVSRITSGRIQLEIEAVDLASVVEDVVGRFAEEIRRVGASVLLRVKARGVGQWDRMRLDQVVTNLLSNALKYGQARPVEVTVDADDHRAWFAVSDQGPGVEPADQERIFERFERAASDRHVGGFGLGLWIVREIVAAMGGTVRVESASGNGATFRVELPRSGVVGVQAPPTGETGALVSRSNRVAGS